MQAGPFRFLHVAIIVNFPYIDELLSSCPCNIFWKLLAKQSFNSGFNGIHWITRPPDTRGEIGYARTLAYLVDQRLASNTEAFTVVS